MRKSPLQAKEEVSLANWLPVSCIRTIEGLIKKVQTHGPFEALKALRLMKKLQKDHPRYQELLIIIVEKWV